MAALLSPSTKAPVLGHILSGGLLRPRWGGALLLGCLALGSGVPSAHAAASLTRTEKLTPIRNVASGSLSVTARRASGGQVAVQLDASVSFRKPKKGKPVRPFTLVLLVTPGDAVLTPASSEVAYAFSNRPTLLRQFVLRPGATRARWNVTPPNSLQGGSNTWTDCVVVRGSVPGDAPTVFNFMFMPLTVTTSTGQHIDAPASTTA